MGFITLENCNLLFLGLQVSLHVNYIHKKLILGQLHVVDNFESLEESFFFFFTLFLPNKKTKHFILAKLLKVFMDYL